IGCPQPGFFESTTATPLAMTKTAVLPPPPAPRSTNRLSLTFSTSMTFGAFGSGWARNVIRPPTAIRIPITKARFITCLPQERNDNLSAAMKRLILALLLLPVLVTAQAPGYDLILKG